MIRSSHGGVSLVNPVIGPSQYVCRECKRRFAKKALVAAQKSRTPLPNFKSTDGKSPHLSTSFRRLDISELPRSRKTGMDSQILTKYKHLEFYAEKSNQLATLIRDTLQSPIVPLSKLARVADQYMHVLTLYNKLISKETPPGSEMLEKKFNCSGRSQAIEQWAIELTCRYFSLTKDKRHRLIFIYHIIRRKGPLYEAYFQKTVILAHAHAYSLPKAVQWAQRFIRDGNFYIHDRILPLLISCLGPVTYLLDSAIKLVLSASKKYGLNIEAVLILCRYLAGTNSPNPRLLFLLELLSDHKFRLSNERFGNLLHWLAESGHVDIVDQLFHQWRDGPTMFTIPRRNASKGSSRHNILVYNIVFKALLDLYRRHLFWEEYINSQEAFLTRRKLANTLAFILDDMGKNGIKPDSRFISSMLRAFTCINNNDLAKEAVFASLKNEEINKDKHAIICTASKIFIHEHKYDVSRSLLGALPSDKQGPVTESLQLQIILEYDRFNENSIPTREAFENAIEFARTMKSGPTLDTMHLLVQAAMCRKDFVAARDILFWSRERAGTSTWRYFLMQFTRELIKMRLERIDIGDLIELLNQVISQSLNVWKCDGKFPARYQSLDRLPLRQIYTNNTLREVFKAILVSSDDCDVTIERLRKVLSILDGNVLVGDTMVMNLVRAARHDRWGNLLKGY